MKLTSSSSAGLLPDSLQAGLNIVFVGTAAGHRSAAVGAYYAHPGNRFWRTLHETGLTDTQRQPAEFRTLLDNGIGFTDIAKFASGMDHEIAKGQFDVTGFISKIAHFRPRMVAFTSKRAASLVLGRSTRRLAFGLQSSDLLSDTRIFVLPSPSGAARGHWSIEPWRDVAAMAKAANPASQSD